jgi:hypothetical protein
VKIKIYVLIIRHKLFSKIKNQFKKITLLNLLYINFTIIKIIKPLDYTMVCKINYLIFIYYYQFSRLNIFLEVTKTRFKTLYFEIVKHKTFLGSVSRKSIYNIYIYVHTRISYIYIYSRNVL